MGFGTWRNLRGIPSWTRESEFNENYMFVVACHVRYLIFGGFVSETVEEISSEVSTLSSKRWINKYGSLVGGTYFKSICVIYFCFIFIKYDSINYLFFWSWLELSLGLLNWVSNYKYPSWFCWYWKFSTSC